MLKFKRMRIKVSQLGAIKETSIDLNKKLTVFCGPNGTGKTYMAYLLYSITKFENKSFILSLDEEKQKKFLENNFIEIDLDFDIVWQYKNDGLETIKNNLWNIFAIPESKSKDFFSNTQIELLETRDEFNLALLDLDFVSEFKIYDYNFSINKSSGSKNVTISIPEKTLKNTDFIKIIDIILLSRVYSLFAYFPITSSTIFPVERNSIYTFSNELSIRKNDALEHIQAITNKKDFSLLDLFFKRSTRYPEAIRDGLEVAEDLENIQKRSSVYNTFANEIESELLKGKVIINKEGNVEFSSDKAPKIKLSFHQSSSIVKTLASLVIYLKHRASKNDLVIIDEPELNLHPDNQVKLARIFARLINNGIRLVISTHSDYIIRELNNLIMIANNDDDVKEVATKFGYKEDEYINIKDICAYFFNYKNKSAKQTDVRHIIIDENGFDVETLDSTVEKLNQISDELYYTLQYGKAKE